MGDYGWEGLFKQVQEKWTYRIIESFQLEKTLKIEFNCKSSSPLASVVLHKDASEDFNGIFWEKCK